MKQLVDGVEKLVKAEYEQAIENFGYNHSNHESMAVLWEEVQEAKHEYEHIEATFRQIRRAVFADDCTFATESLKRSAILAAAECIQVAAMAEKFKASDIVNTSEEVVSDALEASTQARRAWKNYEGKEDEE